MPLSCPCAWAHLLVSTVCLRRMLAVDVNQQFCQSAGHRSTQQDCMQHTLRSNCASVTSSGLVLFLFGTGRFNVSVCMYLHTVCVCACQARDMLCAQDAHGDTASCGCIHTCCTPRPPCCWYLSSSPTLLVPHPLPTTNRSSLSCAGGCACAGRAVAVRQRCHAAPPGTGSYGGTQRQAAGA
jgi:hypothetical protein